MRPEPDRPLTRRDRLALASLLAIAGLLVAACDACGAPAPSPEAPGRSPAAQWSAAVRVRVRCAGGIGWLGSGSIASPTVVLTAAHVARPYYASGDAWHPCPEQAIAVTEIDGTERVAEAEALLPGADVARLRLSGMDERFSDDPPIFGPRPGLGEVVCVVDAAPSLWRRCGTSQLASPGRIRVDVVVEHGNSGAGMYDQAGRLVGVVTDQWQGEGGQIVGGEGAALDSIPWALPE